MKRSINVACVVWVFIMGACVGAASPATLKWRPYIATAYSHGCAKPTVGPELPARRGANNKWPVANLTVAADRSIPMGTTLLVSYGNLTTQRVVGDRGRGIGKGHIDLFMADCGRASRWGRRTVYVAVVE